MRGALLPARTVREGFLVSVGLAAGAAGAFAAAIAPLVPVLAVLALIAMAITVQRPHVPALAAAMLMLALPRELLFDLPLPLGPIAPTDLLILLALGGHALRRVLLRRPEPTLDPMLVHLVVLLQLVAAVAVVTAYVNGVPLTRALSELRVVVAYALVLPLGVYLARADLRRTAALFLAAGSVGSGFVLVSYLLGRGSTATYTSGVLRVEGFFAPLLTLIVALGLLGLAHRTCDKVALLAVTGFAGAALLFTFQRGAWLAAIAGLGVLYVLLPAAGRQRLGMLLPVVIIAAALTAVLVNQRSVAGSDALFSSVGTRVSSLGQADTDVSSRHRVAEFEEGVAVTRDHLWTGIGLGGAITFVSPLHSSTYNTSGVQATAIYLHSSWLWMAVKTGLPGLVVLGLVLFRTVALALRARRARVPRDPLPLVLLALLTTLGVLALSGPHFTSDDSSAVVALILAGASAAASRVADAPGRTGKRHA